MDDKIREKAEEKFMAKRGFTIVTTVFLCVSIILYIISLNVDPLSAYWVRFPIMVLGLVLLIIYVSLFGFSLDSYRELDWEEEEIFREMAKIKKKELHKRLESADQNPESLDLKHLEVLEEKQKDRR